MNFFSKILKQKKAVFFVFLGIFIFSYLLWAPHTVKAQGIDSVSQSLQNEVSNNTKAESDSDQCSWKNVSSLEKIGAYFIVAITSAITFIPKTLSNFAIGISGWTIKNVLDWPITTGAVNTPSEGFVNGWATVRDFANMLIVLGFVIVGVATALRFREYEAKKALAPLIIVAILVNFSALICGLIIDASRITTVGILNQGKSPTTNSAEITDQFMGDIRDVEYKILCEKKKNGKVWEYAFAAIELSIIYWLVGLSFIYLAIIIVARYAILGILFIFSPIAFAFWGFPFPKAKDLWNKWWSNFLKYAFVGVGIAFFLNISSKVLQAIPTNTRTNLWGLISYLLVVMAIMVVGIFVSLKSSGALSAAVMGAALAVGGAALGAIGNVSKLAGKGIDSATGGAISGAGRKMKSGTGRLMEQLGLRAQGTTALSERGQMKDAETRVGAMTEQEAVAAANSNARSTDAKRVRIAAIQRLAKSGDINKLGDVTTQNAAVQWAESRGRSVGADTSNLRKDATSSSYQLAGYDSEKINRVALSQGISYEDAHRNIVHEQLASNLPKMSAGDIGRINPDHISGRENYDFVRESFNANTIDKIQTAANPQLITAMRGHLADLNTARDNARRERNKAEQTRLQKMIDAINRLP